MASVLPLTFCLREGGSEKLSIDMDGLLGRILNLNKLQITWYSVQTRPGHGLQSDRCSSSALWARSVTIPASLLPSPSP